MRLSLSVQQAIDLAHVFLEQDIQTTVQIKKLSDIQKKICYLAFKVVENTTVGDMKSKDKKGSISEKQIEDITTQLKDVTPPEVPKDVPLYKRPINWIAHIISSIAKAFANLFWRVGSDALLTKAKNYYNDVNNAQKKINKYHKGDQLATSEEKRLARYQKAKARINSAKSAYSAKGKELELLRNIHNKLRLIEFKGTTNCLDGEIAERFNLGDDDKARIGKIQQFKQEPVHKVMLEVLKINKRGKDADGSLKYQPLEKDILKHLEAKVLTVAAEYVGSPKPKRDKMDSELEQEYVKATDKFAERKSNLYETNKKRPAYAKSIAKAKANLESEIAEERRLKAKEDLLSKKYKLAGPT